MVNESKRWKADCSLAEEVIIKMTLREATGSYLRGRCQTILDG